MGKDETGDVRPALGAWFESQGYLKQACFVPCGLFPANYFSLYFAVFAVLP
jgi:hypothetical protein